MNQVCYSVDADDILVSISEGWAPFAEENGAPHLGPAAVVGQPIWSFIAGQETRHIYESLFRKARETGKAVEVPFRCDSPAARRHMRITIEPTGSEGLTLRSELLLEEPRDRVDLLDIAAERSEELVTLCSWCRRVKVTDGSWEETEVAIARLGLFQSTPLPRLTHGICPDCAEQMAVV